MEYKGPELEVNSGEKLVETAGYVAAQDKIENMLLAGRNIEQQNYYDFNSEEEIDDDYMDPFRSKNLDMVDIQNITEHIAAQASEKAAAAQAAAAEKAAAQAEAEKAALKESLRAEIEAEKHSN